MLKAHSTLLNILHYPELTADQWRSDLVVSNYS